MVFHWSLSDLKSLGVFSVFWLLLLLLLYSLRVFHNSISWWSFTGVWVTTSLLRSLELFSVFWFQQCFGLYSLSSSTDFQFLQSFGIIPSGPITIGITITFMFHSFFSSLARSKYLSIFLLTFIFNLEQQNPQDDKFFFLY